MFRYKAASGDGRVIFVADPDTHCVHRYDLDKGRYHCLMINRGQMLLSPIGLAASVRGFDRAGCPAVQMRGAGQYARCLAGPACARLR